MQQKFQGLDGTFLPHEQLKAMSASVKFAVRTGEFTPYPNVILTAGVAF